MGLLQWNNALVDLCKVVVMRREHPQLVIRPIHELNGLVRQVIAGITVYAQNDYHQLITGYLECAHSLFGMYYDARRYRTFIRKLDESAKTGLKTCIVCLLNDREFMCRDCSK
jgi:hypothetical protein